MGKIVKLTFLGDVMCKEIMLDEYKTDDNKYDFSEVFIKMEDYFRDSDYVFANLETPISYDNSDLTKAKFCFNSPYEFAKAVFDSGIHFVATSNNHCLDRGIDGICSTVKCLDEIGFKHTGVFSNPKKDNIIINVDGLKLGVLSYTYGTNAFLNNNYLEENDYWRVNLFRSQELSNKFSRYLYKKRCENKIFYFLYLVGRKLGIKRFKKAIGERKEKEKPFISLMDKNLELMKSENPDLIIMYMHSGGQYNKEATKYTKRLAESLLDKGVNIVVGSHEHVVHSGLFSNIDKNKLATYSLGNFNGVSNIYEKPYDKMSNYSIAWNVYIGKTNNNVKIEKTTFSVLKTIPTGEKTGGIQTVLASELLEQKYDKKLEDDIKIIASTFLGKKVNNICREYQI